MKLIHHLAIIILAIILCNCSNHTKAKRTIDMPRFYNYQYQRLKSELKPEFFFTHYPNTLPVIFSHRSITDDMARCYSYCLLAYYDNDESFTEIKKDIKKSSIKNFQSTDTTMLILKHIYPHKKIIERLKLEEILIPYFDFNIILTIDKLSEKTIPPKLFSAITPSGLSPNFEIFILKSESVYSSTNTDRIDHFEQLPRTHNEAYTQGVCLNEKDKCAIYWTIFY